MKFAWVVTGAVLAVLVTVTVAVAAEPEPPPGSSAACHKTAFALIGAIDGGDAAASAVPQNLCDLRDDLRP